jgi:hypothetical protein
MSARTGRVRRPADVDVLNVGVEGWVECQGSDGVTAFEGV